MKLSALLGATAVATTLALHAVTPAVAATDGTAPKLLSFTPASSASNVNPGNPLFLTFNEAMRTVPTFTLKAANRSVPVTMAYDSSKTVLTITPGAILPWSTSFSASVSAAQDLAGNKMSQKSWSFKTAAEPATPKGMLALSFDDGPGKHTGLVLDILKTNDVKATFFLNGGHIAQYPQYVKREVAEGHVIGNHGWDHANFKDTDEEPENGLTPLTYAAARKSIVDTAAAIKAQTGINYCSATNMVAGCEPMLFRFPYGDESAAGNQVIREEGMWGGVLWRWAVNPEGRGRTPFDGDWDCSNTVNQMSNYVKLNAADQAILLLHDAGDEAGKCSSSHYNYLKTLLPELKAAGWSFGVVAIAYAPSPVNQQSWVKVVQVVPAAAAS